MVLVRDVFQVKINQMDKVLAGLRAALESNPDASNVSRVLTDISGPHFTLVIETKAESMDAYWSRMQESFQDPEQAERTSPFAELMEHGHRTFYTIEYEADA